MATGSLEKTSAGLAIICGLAAACFTLMAGARNPSILLKSLFVVWVLAPFPAMFWGAARKRTFAAVSVAVALVSVAIYAIVAMHPTGKVGPPFLMAPIASWVVLGAAWLLSR